MRLPLLTGLILTGALVAGASPAAATADVSTRRLAGPDRYGTAAAIFNATFGASTQPAFAVVAPGNNFPDALSGINLLGRKQYCCGGPGGVLLTPSPTCRRPPARHSATPAVDRWRSSATRP